MTLSRNIQWLMNVGICIVTVCTLAQASAQDCDYNGRHLPAMGETAQQIRVATMNVYGQNKDNEKKCEFRLREIGRRLANAHPLYSILGLTEVHPDTVYGTCNGRELVDALQSNGHYSGDRARWGHPEVAGYDGGVSLFALNLFPWGNYDYHAHRYVPRLLPRTAHGFVFSRVPVGRGITLDVYVTHIHSTGGGFLQPECNQACKRNELLQLARGIHARSAASGNPVIVMGDFNIGGPNPTSSRCDGNRGYADIMELLRNPRDVWLEAHPDRSGSTHGSQRIDYMFLLDDPYFTNSAWQLNISDPTSVRLLDWYLPGYHGDVGRVSDHLGLEATFDVRPRVSFPGLMTVID